MTMVRFQSIALLFFISAGASAQLVPQFKPETGMYANPLRSGEGAFIEVQGDTVAMAFFTHTADGDSIFYTAAGSLFASGAAEPNRTGYLPVGRVSADLYRTSGGPILGSIQPGQQPYVVTRVGSVHVEFGYLNTVAFCLAFDTSAAPSPVAPPCSLIYLTRVAFGLGTHGADSIAGGWCWPDFLGEWIFIDRSEENTTPLLLNFTERTITSPEVPITCGGDYGPQVLTFRDNVRDGEMRCLHGSPDPLDGVRKAACELRLGGSPEAQFWFYPSDLTPTRVIGSKGPYRPGYARTTETVLGIRVQ
jgi:hypothetical protein